MILKDCRYGFLSVFCNGMWTEASKGNIPVPGRTGNASVHMEGTEAFVIMLLFSRVFSFRKFGVFCCSVRFSSGREVRFSVIGFPGGGFFRH